MSLAPQAASASEARLARELVHLPHRSIDIEAKRTLREEGWGADELMIVVTGLMSAFKDNKSGRQIVALAFPGDLFMFQANAAAPGVQAIIRSEVLLVKLADVNDAAGRDPQLAALVRDRLLRNQAILLEWLVNNGLRDALGRVAHLLCEFAVRSGIDPRRDRLHNPLTQLQIAQLTGQTPVHTNRVLRELDRLEVIRRSHREVGIEDWDELCRLGSFTPDYLA